VSQLVIDSRQHKLKRCAFVSVVLYLGWSISLESLFIVAFVAATINQSLMTAFVHVHASREQEVQWTELAHPI